MAATTTNLHGRGRPEPAWAKRWRALRGSFGGRDAGFAAPAHAIGAGRVSRGRQMASGRFLVAGFLVEAPDVAIWDLPIPDPRFEAELHGFGWLDDLVATGDARIRTLARDWTVQWPERFDGAQGPGWEPAVLGRRLLRWVGHADLIMGGADARQVQQMTASLRRQMRHLSRHWGAAEPGRPRFEALTGLVHAALALPGSTAQGRTAARALGTECAREIGPDGGIAGRNPADLLEVFGLLTAARSMIETAGLDVPPPLRRAIAAVAPALRTLRHGDGGLARFHGGGRGVAGRLDLALSMSGVRPGPPRAMAMGFARLSRGRTTVVIDAAAPPATGNAHASTLAFELTSGRRPLIVNCGSGRTFGADWRRAGRATPSHSTLVLDGCSSARLSGADDGRLDGPRDVRSQLVEDDRHHSFIAGHDGYLATHGLTHVRRLDLGRDGRSLEGEDLLVTVERNDRPAFDRARAARGGEGLPFQVRFHLHPDVVPTLDSSQRTVTLRLLSGEMWHFRHDGRAALSIEDSAYLDTATLGPRPTRQIVLSAVAAGYATRVGWTLAKGRQTPDAVRDTRHDDQPVMV